MKRGKAMTQSTTTAVERRLAESARRERNWQRWGPYLPERQWGVVREDYSEDGESWKHFTYDQSRSRAYRWGEDGLLGFTDRECRLCFGLSLWNGRDPYLKERLFGVGLFEGNHGEDVKESYFYLDGSPDHAYMKALYKYPQSEFPYRRLIEENGRRGPDAPEFEIGDTGVFNEDRYFDVFVEYAKASPNDILIRIEVVNRGPDAAPLHVLPTLWFRNTWVWGCRHEGCWIKPGMEQTAPNRVRARHVTLGTFDFAADAGPDGEAPRWLFTENETNARRLYDAANPVPYVKDAFHELVVEGNQDAVNPTQSGTKSAAWYRLSLDPGESATLRLRLFDPEESAAKSAFGRGFDSVFERRRKETDAFYAKRLPSGAAPEEKRVMRQAWAGLLWSKQFYHYIVEDWLAGDPQMPSPPEARLTGRNHDWPHVFNRDVLSVPDKWEYPWYAAWDLAFHMLPFAEIDPPFAKDQLVLLLREWYMHPNGQMPAYEFGFDDVNPPVHAWAAWRVYKIAAPKGQRDRHFLERTFQKLLLNFTWWVNRKDRDGHNLFSGGFLGLDNIGVFDRSKPLPTGGHLRQADGTAWMGFYCLTMMTMSMELVHDGGKLRVAYGDMASKFFEHFIQICDAMNTLGGAGLWDEEDGFYYDQIRIDGGKPVHLKVRSMVGLLPLIAVTVLDRETIDLLPGFKKRFDWFLENRRDLAQHISWTEAECCPGQHRWLLAIPSRERLLRVLRYLLDEEEFLSPYGIRSLSKYHQHHPYVLRADGQEFRVGYAPGESDSYLFGGNSNWRGPVWFPVNYLLIEALEQYHHYYGDDFKVECPTGSGDLHTLKEVADTISRRLASLFLPNEEGKRPCHGDDARHAADPHWRDLILFHEYFHGDTGRGLGASHQTGWTALVTRLLGDLCPRQDGSDTYAGERT